MKVSDFANQIAKQEGKKVQTSVGNVREVLKLANKATGGLLYKIIRSL